MLDFLESLSRIYTMVSFAIIVLFVIMIITGK